MSSFELFLDNFGLVIIWILLAVSCFLCLLKCKLLNEKYNALDF